MDILPALTTRPMTDAYADALDPAAPPPPPARTVVQSALRDGLPTHLPLDATRQLVLTVPLGTGRPLLEADPRTVVIDLSVAGPPAAPAPLDLPRARLTLLVDGHVADTCAVVPMVALRLSDGPRAVVELVVDRLVLSIGALRGPGSFGSLISLRWRDLLTADDVGPDPTPGDPALGLAQGANP